jgi:hypothetical protein
VKGWTCPTCGRFFGRQEQRHDCAPGLSLEEYFSTGPPHERPVFDAVYEHVRTLGPVHLDVVSVGVFFKNPRMFAQLRPMQRWCALSFSLPRAARHRTITRKVQSYGGGHWHVANVATPSELDDDLKALLTEAYELARARPGRRGG